MVSIWKYARDDLNNFLVFYLPSECEINEFELKMSSNLQTYFLTPIYDEMFDLTLEENCALTKRLDHKHSNVEIMSRRVIKYKISNTVMLSSYLNGSETRPEQVFSIMEQILDIYYTCIDYLLIPNQILFDLDKIFFDFRTQKVYMVYLPVNEYDGFNDFKEFISSYFNLFLDKKTNSSMAFNCYESIIRYCEKENFCMDGFKNIILYYKKEISKTRFDRENDRLRVEAYVPTEFSYFKKETQENADIDVAVSIENSTSGIDCVDYGNRDGFIDYHDQKRLALPCKEQLFDQAHIDQYILKRKSRKLKSFLFKAIGIYFFLIILFLLLINNSNRLFGDSSEIKIFIAILFFSISIYCYIRFLHEELIDILEQWRKDERKNSKLETNSEEKSYLKDLDLNRRKALFHDVTEQKNMYFETELLSSNHRNYLINTLTGEKIYIDKDIFKIGRHEDENDFVVEDRSVGRFHVQLDTSEKGVEITDLGSKNGTFINNSRIFPYTKSILNKGDIVRLAGISFSFNS